MSRLGQWLRDLIYPDKCVICRRLLKPGEDGVCRSCAVDLPDNTSPIVAGRFYERCIAPFRYMGTLRESLLRFKFGDRQSYARFYGRRIAQAVQYAYGEEYDVVSWVPVSSRRRAERGFDQAQLLAKHAARALDKPLCRTLRKVRHNKRQSSITEDSRRRSNVLNAYRAYRPERWRGSRILLIDDIITSGATLDECSGVLRMAGSAEVYCAVAATAKF